MRRVARVGDSLRSNSALYYPGPAGRGGIFHRGDSPDAELFCVRCEVPPPPRPDLRPAGAGRLLSRSAETLTPERIRCICCLCSNPNLAQGGFRVMTHVLEVELKTYEQHRDKLLGTAEGKYVLIRDDQVVGVFDSKMDAIAQGYQRFGNVPFLVKQVLRVEVPQSFALSLLRV